MKFLMVYPNSTGNTKVPLGIIYLLTLLKQAGHQVELFDMTFSGVELEKHDINIRGKMLNFKPVDVEPYGVTYSHKSMRDVEDDLIGRIKDFEPDLIGVSITEDTSVMGFRLATVAKASTKAPILFGGVYCLANPEAVIKEPCVDMLCYGDGELLILDLANGIPFSGIKGLWTKQFRNPLASPFAMDRLPYLDLSLIDQRHLFNPMAGHVYKMSFVQSQRGCPRRCSYCCNQLFLNTYKSSGGYLRKQCIQRFVDEIAYLKENWGLNFIQIVDDDFVMRSMPEIEEFSRLYKQQVDLPFWIQAEANHVTTEKMVALRNAGLMAVSIGIETGSDFIRTKVYKRNTSKEATVNAFNIMHKLGIRTSGNIIIGVPYESRTEIFETIALTRECNPKSLNVNIFAPYYGTELREMAVRMGYLDKDFRRESAQSWKPVLDMPQISQDEIMGLTKTFVLYCTLPLSYWSVIAKCEVPGVESDRLFSELEAVFWGIAEKNGINYDIPNFNYEAIKTQYAKV